MCPLFSEIVDCNSALSGCRAFVTLPGMEFGSYQKWWSAEGLRPTGHEGLDIFCYRKKNAALHYFTPDVMIPAMASGVVRGNCRDFLGGTLFVEHKCEMFAPLLAAYAHIVPEKGLVAGDFVRAGDTLGHVADTSGRKVAMNCHLHISFLQPMVDSYEEYLNWDAICGRQAFRLFDPLLFLDGNGWL